MRKHWILYFVTLLGLSLVQASNSPYTLHRYAAGSHAWNTNSYWLESKDGIVLIDGQLLKSDARYLAAIIKANGKPVKGALLTHPHPDHMAGFTELRKQLGYFPIYATKRATQAAIENYQQFLSSKFSLKYGRDVEQQLTLPDNLLKHRQKLVIAGMELEIHALGAGEASDHILIYNLILALVVNKS